MSVTSPRTRAPAPTPGPEGPFDGAADPDDLTRPLYGATFGQAVPRFFRSYAKFSGRASRSEYWWVALFTLLVAAVPAVLAVVGLTGMTVAETLSLNGDDGFSATRALWAGAGILFALGVALLAVLLLSVLVPSLALAWRRLHDANLPGPLAVLTFATCVPHIGWLADITMIIFALLPSRTDGRRFDV